MNTDGTPKTSRSHTHPSHTQISHLLTSSLSLGVPGSRVTQCTLPVVHSKDTIGGQEPGSTVWRHRTVSYLEDTEGPVNLQKKKKTSEGVSKT
jgi:hypothetical protein